MGDVSAQLGRHAGVIVLRGAVSHPDNFVAYGQVPSGDTAEWMTMVVGLVRQHPQQVFFGGEGRVLTTGVIKSQLAQAFCQQQGLDMTKVHSEDGSRNTRENPSK